MSAPTQREPRKPQYVVIRGLSALGPYDSAEKAHNAGDAAYGAGNYEVAPLEPPTDNSPAKRESEID